MDGRLIWVPDTVPYGVDQPRDSDLVEDLEPKWEPGSWAPINLADDMYAIPPDPPCVLGLIYEARRHVLSGPPESAKTLVAYICLLTAHRQRMPVAIIDFEMGPVAARRLLHELGATIDELRDIYYVSPTDPPRDGLQGIIDHGARLVLVDAAIGAYDASGLDDNARKDAEQFARTWIRPLWDNAIATLLVDHVTKNMESRGKFTIGSERKLGQADVHLGLEALKPLTRGSTGLVKVHVHKDRPAFLPRPTAAVIELQSDPETHHVTWRFRDPHPTDEITGVFRPTTLMEKISRYLELKTDPVSRNVVETDVKGNTDAKRQALDVLTAEGYIVETQGARGARLVFSDKPYRAPDETTNGDFAHLASTSPKNVGEVTSPTPPPLQGAGRSGRGEKRSTSPNGTGEVKPNKNDDSTAGDFPTGQEAA